MKRGLLLIVLLVALVVASLYYLDYIDVDLRKASPYLAVPENCPAFAEIRQVDQLIATLQELPYYEEISGTPLLARFLNQVDVLNRLFGNNALVSAVWEDDVVVTLNSISSDQLDMLYIFRVGNLRGPELQQLLDAFARSGNELQKRVYLKNDIYEVRPDTIDSAITLAFKKQLLLVSFSPYLVEESIASIENGSGILRKPGFEGVYQKSSGESQADLYVQYDRISALSPLVFQADYSHLAKAIGRFASWSKLELLFSDEALYLNGYTYTLDSLYQSLGQLRSAAAKEMGVIDLVPSNVALLDYSGIVRVGRYLDQLSLHNEACKVEYLADWLGQEWVLGIAESFKSKFDKNAFAIVEVTDADLALQNLGELSRLADTGQFETIMYGSYDIRRYMAGSLQGQQFNDFFGSALVKLRNPYYTILEGHLVFANSLEQLKSVLDRHASNETLARNLNYIGFTDLISTSANHYFYLDGGRSKQLLNAILRKPDAHPESRDDLLNKLTFSIQNSWLNDLAFTNAVIQYKEVPYLTENELWKTALDTAADFRPALVKNHYTGQNEIVVQDLANTVYLIDQSGEILWKRKIGGRILSDIFQIDYYKNGKLQMVFNTSDQIHMLDRNGENVESYPLKLSGRASNGMQLVDYDGERDYRIFVACEGKGMYGYYKTGKPVSGWSPKEFETALPFPLQHRLIGRKDYLCVLDSKGSVSVFNRRGKRRFKPVETAIGFTQNFFVDDNAEQLALVNGWGGTIYQIDADGKLTTNELSANEKSVQYIYGDLAKSPGFEHAFFDGQVLAAYSGSGTQVYRHDHGKASGAVLSLQADHPDAAYAGLYFPEENRIYLIDRNGSVHRDFPLVGHSDFSLVDLFGNGEKVVLVANPFNGISAYRIQ